MPLLIQETVANKQISQHEHPLPRYEVKLLGTNDSVRWDTFIISHPLGNALATANAKNWWQQVGWSFQPVALFEKDSIVGGVIINTIKIPYLPWTLARITTILLTDNDIVTKTKVILNAAAQFAHSQKALQIEVRSGILDGPALNKPELARQIQQALCQSDYIESNERDGTYLVRINMDDEALLNSLGSKCRRDIRKAQREGVTVSELRSPEALQVFGKFHQQMISRKELQNLRHISAEAYESLKPLLDYGHIKLFAAHYKNHICNMAIIDALGTPKYFIGTTTTHTFEKGTPPTGQLLHYEIMQFFREKGVQYYDLGGSPGPVPIEKHPNYPVWRFKHEFGGAFTYTIPFYRLCLTPAGKVLTSVARQLGLRF